MRLGSRSLFFASAAVVALSSQVAYAQEGGAEADDNVIVVTAQFRAQNLQDTPLAISAVNAEMLEARGQDSISDVAARAPSVTIEQSSNGGGVAPQLTIRGIGQTDFFPAVEPGVGVYIDDVYYGLMVGAAFDLVDVSRVEVLRGPQGTLSGRNSVGGSIKLFSEQPAFDLAGYGQLTYGSFNRMEARGSINLPLVDDVAALRVSGVVRQKDGWLDRLDYGCANRSSGIPDLTGTGGADCVIGSQGGENIAALRASLLVNWSDSITHTVSADVIRTTREQAPSVLVAQGPWATGFNFITDPKSLTNYNSLLGNAYNLAFSPFVRTAYRQQFNFRDEDTANQWGISNVFDIDLSDSLSLKSITAYRETTAGMAQTGSLSPINVYTQDYSIDYNQFSQELRLSGSSDRLDWTVGGFYFENENAFIGRIFLDGGIFPGGGGIGLIPTNPAVPINPGNPATFIDTGRLDFINDDIIKSSTTAAFAHGTVHVAEALNLTLGIRYTDEKKTYTFGRRDPNGGALHPSQVPLIGLVGNYAGDRIDYRVALDYRFSDSLLVYGQFSTGFKGGGVNPRTFFATQVVPFDPETVKSYELGFKSDFFDKRLRLNVAAFFTDYSDIQIINTSCPDITPNNLPGPCTATRNSGDGEFKGVEFEMMLEPVDGLQIDLSGSFIDFKYTSINPLTSIRLDSEFPFLAKTKLAGGIQYAFPAFGGTVTPRLDFDYRSSFFTEGANGPFNLVESRTLANARIAYQTEDRDWEVALNVSNLFDNFYFANRFDRLGPPFFAAQAYIGTPREWSLSIKRSF